MKLCVISPKGCSKSAKELAVLLGATYDNPYNSGRTDYSGFDGVFNYGVSYAVRFKNIINHPASVKECLSKTKTFQLLEKAGVPIPKFTTKIAEIPKDWDTVVVRTTDTGRGNEGTTYVQQWSGEIVKEGVLFTEYIHHEWEYRIVLFRGVVVGRFKKEEYVDEKDNQTKWDFAPMLPDAFEAVDEACLKAAKALQIDYVGFDVVETPKGDFFILEANSGPVLIDEVGQYIVKQFKG